MSRSLALFAIIALLVPGLSAQNVSVYQTTSDLSQKLSKQSDVQFAGSGTASTTITIDDTKTFQQIDGFGASFTDSSAWLVYTKLTANQRNDAMQKLFSRTNGIALGFLRQPMGSSDLARTFYSYDDLCTQTTTACTTPSDKTDPTLANFSIDHDKDYIVPVLQQALAINPNVKIMANPWSPPGWMKTNGSMLGHTNIDGSLRTDAYDPLAQYFVKFIQAYEAEGVRIDYISMQNEPLYAPTNYAGMMMQPSEQANFLGNYLGPALAKAGLNTKVMVWDHNWDNTSYSETVLADAKANSYAAGVAWHHYAGDPSAMSAVHDMYPDKDVWETEASGGYWAGGDSFKGEALELINTMRNWAKSYVLWNMALDQDNGPYVGGCTTCRGLFTVTWDKSGAATPAPSTVKYEFDYYVLGQASKFVQPGAYRIDSDMAASVGINDVAFRNPDGSIVLYVLNNGTANQTFNVKSKANYFTTTVPAGAVATFIWNPSIPATVSLNSTPAGLSLASGAGGSVGLTVAPLNGTSNVTLGCQVLDANDNPTSDYTCAATDTNLTFADTSAVTTTINVTPGTILARSRHNSGFALLGFGMMPLMGLVALGTTRKRRAAIAIVVLSSIALTLVACGGGGSSPGTSTQPAPVQVAAGAPIFIPAAGTYSTAQNVTITSATAGATIYYTTDGSTPTTSSTKYTAAVPVTKSITLKALATASDYTNSVVSTAAYDLKVLYTVAVTATTDSGVPVQIRVPMQVAL